MDKQNIYNVLVDLVTLALERHLDFIEFTQDNRITKSAYEKAKEDFETDIMQLYTAAYKEIISGETLN